MDAALRGRALVFGDGGRASTPSSSPQGHLASAFRSIVPASTVEDHDHHAAPASSSSSGSVLPSSGTSSVLHPSSGTTSVVPSSSGNMITSAAVETHQPSTDPVASSSSPFRPSLAEQQVLGSVQALVGRAAPGAAVFLEVARRRSSPAASSAVEETGLAIEHDMDNVRRAILGSYFLAPEDRQHVAKPLTSDDMLLYVLHQVFATGLARPGSGSLTAMRRILMQEPRVCRCGGTTRRRYSSRIRKTFVSDRHYAARVAAILSSLETARLRFQQGLTGLQSDSYHTLRELFDSKSFELRLSDPAFFWRGLADKICSPAARAVVRSFVGAAPASGGLLALPTVRVAGSVLKEAQRLERRVRELLSKHSASTSF